MQENGTEQPKVYRCTRTMLKIRPTPTDGEQTAQMKEWITESRSVESNTPAILYEVRDCSTENSQENTSSYTVQLPLPRLDLPGPDFSENREESHAAPLCTDDTALEPDAQNAQCTPYAPGTRKSTCENQPNHLVTFMCKDTIAPGSVDYQLVNVEL